MCFCSLKTRVFVTHGVTFLPQVDQIITVKDGEISEMGTYNELLQRNGAFAEFIKLYLDAADDGEDEEEDPEGISLLVIIYMYLYIMYAQKL